MKTNGYIQEYPCKCSGGDMCYIVRHPDNTVDYSYTTRKEADRELEKINEDKPRM